MGEEDKVALKWWKRMDKGEAELEELDGDRESKEREEDVG